MSYGDEPTYTAHDIAVAVEAATAPLHLEIDALQSTLAKARVEAANLRVTVEEGQKATVEMAERLNARREEVEALKDELAAIEAALGPRPWRKTLLGGVLVDAPCSRGSAIRDLKQAAAAEAQRADRLQAILDAERGVRGREGWVRIMGWRVADSPAIHIERTGPGDYTIHGLGWVRSEDHYQTAYEAMEAADAERGSR